MSQEGVDNHVGDNVLSHDSQDQLMQMLVELVIETQTRGDAEADANYSQNLAAKLADDSQKNLEQQKPEGSDTTDRISDLPEFIVHHILSFLDFPLELVRSSVLSKKWFALTASFPILDFCVHNFTRSLWESGIPSDIYNDSGYVRDKFFKYVDYTMSRFCEQNLCVHRFDLLVALEEPTDVDIIDKWLRLILKKDVQVLEININYELAVGTYRMPNILLSASSLTSLTIASCELPSSLMVDDVKFKSLKLLELESICIDEEVIKRLTTSCPLLDELVVKDCDGFKRFCVYRHQNLQKVMICFKSRLETIDIEAPNLSFLYLEDMDESGMPSMNLATCKKLTLLLEHFSLPSIGLANPLSNFDFLENLFMILSWQHNKLKLSSPSLRKFVICYSECDLEEIDINTPNLLLFQYASQCSSHSNIPNPMVWDSTESKARMECYPKEDDVDTLWFKKLRRFLDKKNDFKVLKLHISANFIDVDELKAILSPPYELEHVELELDTIEELSDYESVIDAVLWCCRPRSLTLISDFPFIDLKERIHTVKFTYEKLLEQEDEGQTNIQLVLSSSSKPKKHFSNLNSLLTALPHDRLTQAITYIKDKVAQEAV